MPDSSAIDDALVAYLLADSALAALLPDGWYWDEARAGATRFGVVSLVDEADVPQLAEDGAGTPRRAYEDGLYLVKAVVLLSGGGDAKAAAARIDALLEDTDALEVQGYGVMAVHRESRVRATEVDEKDPTVRWLHRGGRYRVQATGA